jgi:tetratricopeptide (TPR) repeat protein
VKGISIIQYTDEHRLTPRERLELFIPVCHAVQHAHQKGIIHRDLKPSNVMIAMYDGRPVPKVIDFGVAKATGPKLTERTLFTEFGAVIGTLEYMSPEQAELNQLDVDTRSDIYSLGVLLYELLTGTTPLERKRVKETALLEALRIIREEEPPKPSTRLTTTEQLATIAANRGTEPKKLSSSVRGELDWIVMKALEKDRSGRYDTANGLARDIERYLNDEAVEACPPSRAYRLKKFVRGNKIVSACFLLLIGAVLALAVSNFQARRHERRTSADQHVDQGRFYQTAGELIKAEQEYRKAIEIDPEYSGGYVGLGDLWVASGQWSNALAQYERSLELEPEHYETWRLAAYVSMAAGDRNSYRRICGQLIERFGRTDDPVIAERIAKTCSLAPNAVTDFGVVERLAEQAITGTKAHYFYRNFMEAKGLADYRAQHFEQAIEWLQGFAPSPYGDEYDAIAFAALAMAHHRLSHSDQARQSLSRARGLITKRPEDWRLRDPWFDWLTVELLVREAEELMTAQPSP